MATSTGEKPQDIAVKINAEVARKVRILAAFHQQSIARYLSDLLMPIVQADYDEAIRRARADMLEAPRR